MADASESRWGSAASPGVRTSTETAAPTSWSARPTPTAIRQIRAMGHAGGGAWLLRGSRSRTPVDLSSPRRRAWEFAQGEPAPFPGGTAYAGASTALGFVDGDRRADVVLTAGDGLAVVYGNPLHRTTSLAALSPAQGVLIEGLDGGGFTKTAVAGDMNGDGRSDLLAGGVGTPGPFGGIDGASYLLFSRAAER